MLNLPRKIIQVLSTFESVFTKRSWETAKILMIGAILAPGQRTVAALLRVMGLSQEPHFQTYHRLLNRARWSSREVSRLLLLLMVKLFVPADAPIVLAIDETIERRRGSHIAKRGIYRDPVRSSESFFVKTSGLRWISMMLLTPICWADRVWALPFLTVLAPSRRYHDKQGKTHKTITEWARQMIKQVHRWLPGRTLVFVADGAYAVVEFLAQTLRLPGVILVTRMRLDACLYDLAPPRDEHTKGRPAVKGKRQPTLAQRLLDPETIWQTVSLDWYGGIHREIELVSGTSLWYHVGSVPVPIRWVLLRDPLGKFESQALLCTDQGAGTVQIVQWFVQRWAVEVTFHEVRTHLGVETQRQWSDLAIERTTPALLGIFSLVTVLAHHLLEDQSFPVRQAAWYAKAVPTFSDTLAFVRRHLWPSAFFPTSSFSQDVVEIPRDLYARLVETLAFTA